MPDQLKESLQRTLGAGFRVGRELGGGGMSRVFVVEDVGLGRETVVKVLHPDMPGAMNVERFRREIHLAATLSHPHIVPLLSAGETDGLPYFSMPFVKGESLRAKLSREGELPVAETVHILRDVALALAHAHSNGVVHRDIKPENILLTGGSAVVTDFGVAKALDHAAPTAGSRTSAGFALGTPAYMAPEQATADPHVDHRADIYAFGILAYELLTGEVPFRGASQQVLAAHSTQEPEALERRRRGIPVVLSNLVDRCLAKRPADRPQSAAELVTMLDSIASTSGERSPYAPDGRRGLRPRWIALPVALAIGAGLWVVFSDDKTDAVDAPKSVAVLPFVNVGGDSTDEYFTDGMTDELTGALSRVEGLRVASRSSAFSFKGDKDIDVRNVGTKLNVGAVLEGTVRRAGDRLKVSAQLTSTADGLTLWADSYERQVKDVFQVQDDIAKSIVAALRVRLAPEGAAQVTARSTENLEAHDLYLRGRFAWNQRTGLQLVQAARYFEQAIAKDPKFANAHAGVADVYVILPYYRGIAPLTSWAKAKTAAKAALALDSSLVGAHTALAYGTAMYEFDFVAAERGFQRALGLDPNYAIAHQWYADYLAGTGRLEEALDQLRIARRLDPLSLQISAEVGRGLYLLRRYDEALVDLKQTLSLDPRFGNTRTNLGLVEIQKGLYAEALADLTVSVQMRQRAGMPLGFLAYAEGRAGNRNQARQLIAELRASAARGETLPMALAYAYVGVGDTTAALQWLEKAYEVRDPNLVERAFDPAFDPLRSHPRLVALWRRMGISPSSPDWH